MASELRCHLVRWACGTLILLFMALSYVVRLDPWNTIHPARAPSPDHPHHLHYARVPPLDHPHPITEPPPDNPHHPHPARAQSPNHPHPAILLPFDHRHHPHPARTAPPDNPNHPHPASLPPPDNANHPHPGRTPPPDHPNHPHPASLPPPDNDNHPQPPPDNPNHPHLARTPPPDHPNHPHPASLPPPDNANHPQPARTTPSDLTTQPHPARTSPPDNPNHPHPARTAPPDHPNQPHPASSPPPDHTTQPHPARTQTPDLTSQPHPARTPSPDNPNHPNPARSPPLDHTTQPHPAGTPPPDNPNQPHPARTPPPDNPNQLHPARTPPPDHPQPKPVTRQPDNLREDPPDHPLPKPVARQRDHLSKDPPDQCGEPVIHPLHQPVAKYDLTRIRPLNFRQEYKNPCWVAERGLLRCLPYFFLAGFTKCGTTDLWARLVSHPDIVHTHKEPHWFTKLRFSSSGMWNFGVYSSKFGPGPYVKDPHRFITGDGSASTAWDNHLWPLFPGNEHCSEPNVINADYIRHLNPRAKIIMRLRNPTHRLYSGFTFWQHAVQGNRTEPEEFHERVVKTIAAFETCREAHTLRNCAYNLSMFMEHPYDVAPNDVDMNTTYEGERCRLHIGMYSVFVEDWLLRFPRDQILVLRLEDPNIDQQMKTVFRFLGVDQPQPDAMERFLTTGHVNMGKKKDPMLEKTRQILDRFYRPFNQRLADILGDRTYLWQDSP